MQSEKWKQIERRKTTQNAAYSRNKDG